MQQQFHLQWRFDILTYRCVQSKGVTNNINDGPFPFWCASKALCTMPKSTHLNGKQPLLKLLNTTLLFDKSACCVKRCLLQSGGLILFLSSLLHHLYSGCCFCMLYPVYYVGVKKCLGGSDCLSDTKPCVFTYCGNPQLQLLQCKTKLLNSHHLFRDILIFLTICWFGLVENHG